MLIFLLSSHPSRVRGLKQLGIKLWVVLRKSHPSRVRGLKPVFVKPKELVLIVAPFTGAWIETIL